MARGPFECPICTLMFKFKTGLDYHLRRTHKKLIEKNTSEPEKDQLTDELTLSTDTAIVQVEEECSSFAYDKKHFDVLQMEPTSDQFEEVLISPQPLLDDQDQMEYSDLLGQIDANYVMVEKITMIVGEDEQLFEENVDQFMVQGNDQTDDDIFDQFIEEDGELDDLTMISYGIEPSQPESSLNSKNLTCKSCGTTFKSMSNLNRHTMRKHDENSHKIVCEQCGKRFLLEFDLRRHLLSHDSAKTIPCPDCNKLFKTLHSLKNHRSLLHSDKERGEKSFQCSHCHRSYFQERHLHHHMRKHLKDERYKCDRCSSSFHYQTAISWHRIRVHGELAPFSCKICKKMFLRQKLFDEHNEDSCVKKTKNQKTS